MKLFKYLFPTRRLQQRLPLLPRTYSAEHSRYGEIPPELQDQIRALRGHGLAVTVQDAHRILKQHKEPVHRIIPELKRKRRRQPRLRTVIRRIKYMFGIGER